MIATNLTVALNLDANLDTKECFVMHVKVILLKRLITWAELTVFVNQDIVETNVTNVHQVFFVKDVQVT